MNTAKALEIWTAQTVCDIGILLSIVSALLHLGRPYFERILDRLTLRVAADLWWLAYVVVRDGALFLSVLLGFWTLNLDLMADIKIGLPFVPCGTVALAGALLLKVFGSEAVKRTSAIATVLVLTGAALNVAGYVLVMEGPGQEYPAAKTAFWNTMRSWRSNANPGLATLTFYVSMALLVAIVTVAIIAVIRDVRGHDAEIAEVQHDVPAEARR